MKLYKKKIKAYKNLIQSQYVREPVIKDVISRCKDVDIGQNNIRASYFEFLYGQCKFIKKKWWGLQGCALALLWILLNDMGDSESIGRIMGAFSVIFVILIIPEIWKNRRCSAIEIEKSSFYSLRQICSARLLLFAIVDLVMVTAFFVITLNTIQISFYSIIINFLIPFNVSSSICFRLLYSKWYESEYIAVCASMVWVIIWSVIIKNDLVYHIIAEPLWIGLVLISFGYLVFCVYKLQQNCEKAWEDESNGIRV